MISFRNILGPICLLGLISGCVGNPKWTTLKVYWCYYLVNADYCFTNVPLTAREALAAGWRDVSEQDCRNGGQFNGFRFIKGKEVAVAALYDRDGTIAGLQFNLVKDELLVPGMPYEFDKVPDYQLNAIYGREVYSLTAYFVDPINICVHGRGTYKLYREGLGTDLYFQHGATPTELVKAPVRREVAHAEAWRDNLCVDTMGWHSYYKTDTFDEDNCTDFRPAFLLFNNEMDMQGFGWSNLGNVTSSPVYEHINANAVLGAMGTMSPKCLLREVPLYGMSNLHVFFIEEPRKFVCDKSLVAEAQAKP